MKKTRLKRKVYYLMPEDIQKVKKNAKAKDMTESALIRMLIAK